LFAPGILYHVIVRGNYRQKTFLGARDYRAYLERLVRYRKRFGVTVYAYCLMSNHAHLLVETGSEPLSRFMQGLQQSYTQYFNRKHHKVGHLFQGRYKAIVCEKDEYLLTLVRYIHLNPIRAKLVHRLDDYPYSGHREYCGVRVYEVLEASRVLDMLGGRAAYRRFVQEGVKDGHREEYYDVVDQRFLGEERFVEKLKVQADEEPETARPKKPVIAAFRNAARALEVEPAVLSGADRSWEVSRHRALIGYVLIRRLGYKLKDVAKCLGRDMATVSSLVSRYSERLAQDEELKNPAARIMKDWRD
jgi:REP element-mobilizing transposase RayT